MPPELILRLQGLQAQMRIRKRHRGQPERNGRNRHTISVAGDGYLPVEEISASCETLGEKGHFIDPDGKLYIEETG